VANEADTSGEKFYLTTAISYPNGAPHIGHAYELMATDAIARFMRLDGRDVFFMTGTDYHGQKMLQTAAQQGVPVRALADRNSDRFEAMIEALSCAPDRFIRTIEPAHYAASQEIWRRMVANGDITLGRYAGWYSVRDEAYYDESETTLQPDGATRLSPQGTPVAWQVEESYFFRLSAYQERLLAFYDANPGFIGPDARRNEVVSFVKSGLSDLSISRTAFDWGVPVPDDPRHVMYVWVDALTNYITGCGFPDETAPRWRYWPADVHIIGKDIVRFHAVYWPAFLMSAGLPLPRRVFGHGFLLNKGEKMSKSIGNVLDPFALVARFGADPLRYFLMREISFGHDGTYSEEAILTRVNADLANDLGNLAQRSLSMIARNCGGAVPKPDTFGTADGALLDAAWGLADKARGRMKDFALHLVLQDIWTVVSDTNRYFASQEPWTLRKTDPARMETVLYVTAEVVRVVALMVQPFVPTSAGKLLDLVAVAPAARLFAHVGAPHALVAGTPLPAPAPVFPRLEAAPAEGE